MNDATLEFNRQLELDVLISGLSEVTEDYVDRFNRRGITDVVIPEGVTIVKNYAFSCCRSLKSVTIGNNITEIGWGAFARCSNLTTVTIGNNITRIGSLAFAGCNLTRITIPNNVEWIGYGAFDGCSGLNNITFKGKTLDEVKAMIFYPWKISPEKFDVQVS